MGVIAMQRSRRETLRVLGDTLFPSIEPGDPGGGDVVPDAVSSFVASGDAETASKLGLVLTLFELGSLPRYGRRFSRLSRDDRDRYVDGWMRSRLAARRVVYRALKQLCALVYYQDPRTWRLLHYDGPLVGRGARASGSTASRGAS